MGETGFIAVLVIDLHFPDSESLKGKRKELSSIKAQLQGRLGAAVAETAHQDTWQRARLIAAVVAGSHSGIRQRVREVSRFLDARWPDGVSLSSSVVSAEELGDVTSRLGGEG